MPRAVSQAPLLAEIPIDPALSAAADTGRPVLVADPESPQAARFRALAAEVVARLGLDARSGLT